MLIEMVITSDLIPVMGSMRCGGLNGQWLTHGEGWPVFGAEDLNLSMKPINQTYPDQHEPWSQYLVVDDANSERARTDANEAILKMMGLFQ